MTTKRDGKAAAAGEKEYPAEKKDEVPQVLGLRVTGATLKEQEGSGPLTVIKVVGYAKGLVPLVGQPLVISTANHGRSKYGRMEELKIKAGKEDGPRTYTCKISGGKPLNELGGLQVTLEKQQGTLPGTEGGLRGEEPR